MSTRFDVIIIGAGIIGCATALKIIQRKPNTRILILEKESTVAVHQTGHNSGVIHSGLYYTPESLKAKNCVKGYHMLIEFCQTHGIRHDICGKLVVASNEQELPRLRFLYERGISNGLIGLRLMSQEKMKEIEPYVAGIQGLFVPQTGIVDYGEVTQKMKELLQEKGVEIWCNEAVVRIRTFVMGSEVYTRSSSYTASIVVNCAGLHADRVARMTRNNVTVRIIPFRGEYYTLKEGKRYLVKNLIYPVPDSAFPFLGVHFTRKLSGDIEAGPNAVFAFKREGYNRNSINLRDLWESISWPGFRLVAKKYWRMGAGEFYRSYYKGAFTNALQKLIPEIQKDDLTKCGSGVRAQACDRTGGLLDDFYMIEETSVIHVCNAPSPAATSSLSIGTMIAGKVLRSL